MRERIDKENMNCQANHDFFSIQLIIIVSYGKKRRKYTNWSHYKKFNRYIWSSAQQKGLNAVNFQSAEKCIRVVNWSV